MNMVLMDGSSYTPQWGLIFLESESSSSLFKKQKRVKRNQPPPLYVPFLQNASDKNFEIANLFKIVKELDGKTLVSNQTRRAQGLAL